MKFLIFIVMIFLLSSLLIISNNNLSFLEKPKIQKFSELYLIWLDTIYSNCQSLTGNAINLKWIPE